MLYSFWVSLSEFLNYCFLLANAVLDFYFNFQALKLWKSECSVGCVIFFLMKNIIDINKLKIRIILRYIKFVWVVTEFTY